jgi:putative inorganic carbon (hco3(-)) transporter
MKTDTLGTTTIVMSAMVIGVAVGLLPVIGGLLIVLGLPLLTAIFVNPRVALILLIFTIPYASLTKVGGETYAVTATDVLVALLALTWFARRIADRALVVRGGPIIAMMVLLLIASLFSTLTAEDFPNALKELIKLGEMLAVALYAASELDRPEDTRMVVVALLLAGASQSIVGLVQFVLGRGPESFAVGPFVRAYGNFEQPNALAGYLGMLLPIGIAFAWRPSPERLLIIGTTAIVGLGVIATVSRGSWLGSALGLGLMALVWSPTTQRALVGVAAVTFVGLALIIAGVVPASVTSRVTSVVENFMVFDVKQVELTPANYSVVQRMALWQAGWDMALDHPLMGVGPANYEEVYERYYVPGWSEPLPHAHNYYLNTFAELGIFGFAVFLGFCATVFSRLATGLRQSNDATGVTRALLIGALGAMVTFSVHNMFDNMFVHGIGIQLALILGLVEGRVAATLPEKTVRVAGPSTATIARGV